MPGIGLVVSTVNWKTRDFLPEQSRLRFVVQDEGAMWTGAREQPAHMTSRRVHLVRT
jgi:hypothetical protein